VSDVHAFASGQQRQEQEPQVPSDLHVLLAYTQSETLHVSVEPGAHTPATQHSHGPNVVPVHSL
jgi:hypothetical protein